MKLEKIEPLDSPNYLRLIFEDGKRLKRHLELEFEKKQNRQIYWDDVAMFCYPKEYQLGIRPMKAEDIIEVDNFSELVALDASYADYAEREENEQ